MIGDRWGVTDEEIRRAYPCDEWVTAPMVQAWRGVTIGASSAAVWPWLTQMRVAPYSYDWIDNLARQSPQTLLDLPEPVAGEPFSTAAGARVGRILAVDPGRHLTGRIAGTVMSYVLVPQTETQTRLLMKLVCRRGRFVGPLITVGDLVMARRQLLNFKRLAEQGDTP